MSMLFDYPFLGFLQRLGLLYLCVRNSMLLVRRLAEFPHVWLWQCVHAQELCSESGYVLQVPQVHPQAVPLLLHTFPIHQ